MKERPILFSGPMVRAILDGCKTQTRRVVKPQPAYCFYHLNGLAPGWFTVGLEDVALDDFLKRCPYGQPGDRLWVRETWIGYWLKDEPVNQRPVFYRADDGNENDNDQRWRPSIHMPRWASRITLEVTGVRVERVQDIGEADARAEGAPDEFYTHPFDWFVPLWDSINAKRGHGWDTNPFVWAIDFRRLVE